jgi:hypothetical protein
MSSEKLNKVLVDQLFSDPEAKLFAVLDAASIPGLLKVVYEKKPSYLPLYRGEMEPDIAVVAPYLVELKADAPFTEWILGEGWGNHWGIFLASSADLPTMRRHLRSLQIVKDHTGKELNFRYYDPRVFRVYLPTCNAEELKLVFGPITSFALEAEDPGQMLRFSNGGAALKKEQISLAAKPDGAI